MSPKQSSIALAAGLVGLGHALGGIGKRKSARLDKAEEIYNELIANPKLRIKEGRQFKRGMTAVQVREMFEANPDAAKAAATGGSRNVTATELKILVKVWPQLSGMDPKEITFDTIDALAQTRGQSLTRKTATDRIAESVLKREWEEAFKTQQGKNRILEKLLSYSLDDIKEFSTSLVFKPLFDKLLQTVEFKTNPRWEGLRQKVSQVTGIGTPTEIVPTGQGVQMSDEEKIQKIQQLGNADAVLDAFAELGFKTPSEAKRFMKVNKAQIQAAGEQLQAPGAAGTGVEQQLQRSLQGQAPVQPPIQPSGTAAAPAGVSGAGIRGPGLPLAKAPPIDNLRALAFLRGAKRLAQ